MIRKYFLFTIVSLLPFIIHFIHPRLFEYPARWTINRGSISWHRISKFLIFENSVSTEDDWRMVFVYYCVIFSLLLFIHDYSNILHDRSRVLARISKFLILKYVPAEG